MISPNINEDYPHYIHRCSVHFNNVKQKQLGDGFGDYPFLLEVNDEVEKLFDKYAVLIENHLDEVYARINNYIRRTGNISGWEYQLQPKELEQILQGAYQELGYGIHTIYHERYAPEGMDKEDRDVFVIFMATALLSRLASLPQGGFGVRTESIARTAIGTGKTIDEISQSLSDIDSAPRAGVISRTELGIAQSIAEAETMRRISEVKPYKKYWLGVLDDRIRDGHLQATQFYNRINPIRMDEWFNVNGELMKHPRDPSASPQNVANCRCFLGYVNE